MDLLCKSCFGYSMLTKNIINLGKISRSWPKTEPFPASERLKPSCKARPGSKRVLVGLVNYLIEVWKWIGFDRMIRISLILFNLELRLIWKMITMIRLIWKMIIMVKPNWSKINQFDKYLRLVSINFKNYQISSLV